MARKLPIGIQSFEKLRTDNFLYVDKTEYIYKLVHNNIPYFLSRPRRFGKSLLLSALKAYWEGKKELFTGLDIERLEEENPIAWNSYPVFYMDFNGNNYNGTAIEDVIDGMLRKWEDIYGVSYDGATLSFRFEQLIINAEKKYGRRAVVLIDEYDKALLETSDDLELQEHIKNVFKGFFGILKKADEHLQFVFITGVTKFHKVSIFSDLNQLVDISMNDEYSGICGITEKEIEEYFRYELDEFSGSLECSKDECLSYLTKYYDGYHFSANGVGVYNPFSLLSAFSERSLKAYWFETGTPTFLINTLRNNNFDARKFTDKTLYITERSLKDYTGDSFSVVPLLYQTGYLTVAEYDRVKQRYTLCFPNDEVKYGFLESLLPAYTPHSVEGSGLDIFTLDEYVENGDIEGIRNILTGLFADITYTSNDATFEHYFQTVIYIVFTLLGKYVQCERHTYTGRIDCVVKTDRFIYIFEFKRDDSAEAAISQINEKGYELPFSADTRKLYKIGVNFSSETRQIDGWLVV